jgi:caffeoyl-CoA O-methyltransferase
VKFIDEALEDYAVAHSDPVPAVYVALTEETWRDQDMARMQVGPMEGRLLKMLVRLSGSKRAIEIGTFTGYSALSIAEGLPEDGTLLACDVNAETTAVAQRYWDQAGWGDRIRLVLAPALETIEAEGGPWDFAFIDADKENYVAYFDALIPRMPSGGLIVADNVLWSGRVLNPESTSDHALVQFNQHVRGDPRVEQVMLPIRDGISVIRKL